MAILFLILFSIILILFTIITYRIHTIGKTNNHAENTGQIIEKASYIQSWIYTAIIFSVTGIIASIYFMVRGTLWEGHLTEWMNIVVRVMHITFGIAWIGASFYFVFLENALNRKDNIRDEIAGDLWAVHGGGFYYLEKYKVAPKEIPKNLHWFKYEAYFTWISGLGLIFIIYYFNASATLIDPDVMKLTVAAAVGISLGSFIVAWIVYDWLCKSALASKNLVFTLTGIILLTGFAFFYSQVFSGRAAFIHFGAMLGSIMVANVFFVIIPSQKAMVNAASKGLLPDPVKGKNALFRSIHNNYFTLPVLFVMVSNHFPGTFGNKYQWIVLAIISVSSAGIKHWLNLRERGQLSVWVLPVSVLLLLSAAYITAPKISNEECKEISFARVNEIITQRCISCHSSRPTDDVNMVPPNGVIYDTPDDIIKRKDLIMQRVVVTHNMPQNNKTNMTLEERDIIRCWIEQGATNK